MPKHTAKPPVLESRDDAKSSLAGKISRLKTLPLDQVRTTWCVEFGKEPVAGLSRDLLTRTLAWRLQEKVFGGHDKATLKLLDAYARGKDSEALFRRLKSGTVLVREYKGVRHTVTIAPNGFIWREKTYQNLSLIAREITGANWNGPRFFGLREGSENSPPEASDQKSNGASRSFKKEVLYG